MTGLSLSGTASKVGMNVTEAAIATAIFEFLREKLISVHSEDLPPALVAVGAGAENPEIVLGRSAELFE